MKTKLGRRFMVAMLIFGLVGQVAWVVENMYLNVFIYKMFHASAADISLMVGASSVAATVTTILIGALSDRMGKRKGFICGGYLLWGVTILLFGLIRTDLLSEVTESYTAACSLGVSLVIVLDCVMTFFGSAANDAAYNAWLTDRGDETNRGLIEGFNSMMPLVAILVVFGGFMGFSLDKANSWSVIFCIIGGVVFVVGLLGIFLIEDDSTRVEQEGASGKPSYWSTVCYSFRPSVVKDNKLLYAVLGAFALFGISIQVYMPYLILYYEQSLKMTNYVLIMAPAIILAAVATAFYGRLYDMQGFRFSIKPSIAMLMGGYMILYISRTTVPVFVGSLLMMIGYMTGMSVFGAMIREHIPENRAGQFQGIRILGQVLIPGIIGPALGAWVLRDAEQIQNSDGTYSFLPNTNIWVGAFAVGVVLIGALHAIFVVMSRAHHTLWTEAGERINASEETPWQDYPRPQLRREAYCNLNGMWEMNREPIRVPFPPQSLLSQYDGKVGSELVYRRSFSVPESFGGQCIRLHFGAVDQTVTVYVNGREVGHHEGGYLPFALDITEVVNVCEENELELRVTDTLSTKYPYGKQCKKRGGMWYTPVSGIWQSVWLEATPKRYIERLVITPDLRSVHIEAVMAGEAVPKEQMQIQVALSNGATLVKTFEGTEGCLELAGAVLEDGSSYEPKLWTPEEPYLYQMTVTVGQDTVESYFALRTIEICKKDGVPKVLLNGRSIFMHGVLDQGYYSDGIYLPAEGEEYTRDILRMKELGYNMLRKHIKVEPERFYYDCDRLGMLVMQDMVNNGSYSFLKDTALPTIGMRKRHDRTGFEGERKEIFVAHAKATIEHLYNHPCIVAYTIFNEGWGQFESDVMYRKVKEWDNTRLVDSTSGWFAGEENDFDSEHIYFKVISLKVKERPLFVSECGGYSMAVERHCYSKYSSYGYGTCPDSESLTQAVEDMYRGMILPAVAQGLCGCIYTQLSDVEDEINGLYTYDRKVCKVVPERMRELARQLQDEVRR